MANFERIKGMTKDQPAEELILIMNSEKKEYILFKADGCKYGYK
ncbi:MAG: hypothetical protein RSC24_06320 [Clostridium sp.]